MKFEVSHTVLVQAGVKSCHEFLRNLENLPKWDFFSCFDINGSGHLEGQNYVVGDSSALRISTSYRSELETPCDVHYWVEVRGLVKGMYRQHFHLEELDADSCELTINLDAVMRIPFIFKSKFLSRHLANNLKITACHIIMNVERMSDKVPLNRSFTVSTIPGKYYIAKDFTGSKRGLWANVVDSYELLLKQLNVHEVSITGVSTRWQRLSTLKEEAEMQLCLEVADLNAANAREEGYHRRPDLKCLSAQMYLASEEIPIVIEKFLIVARIRMLKINKKESPFVLILKNSDQVVNLRRERKFMQICIPVL